MTDAPDIVARLRRSPNMTLPIRAIWTMAEQAADLIEKQAAEIERLGRELNRARYGNPDFSWEAHQAALDAAQAEIERLHLLLAEKALRTPSNSHAGELVALLREALEELDVYYLAEYGTDHPYHQDKLARARASWDHAHALIARVEGEKP